MSPAGLMFVIVASQASEPATPSVFSDDAVEATKACGWDTSMGQWRCDRQRLERFRLVGVASQEGTTTAVVKVTTRGNGTCMTALGVAVSDHSAALLVDWSRVVLAVNGTALQAVPGFARQGTSNLAQRPSVAPVGTALREQIFPVDGDCIGDKRPPYDSASTLELYMPHTIGDEAVTFRWKMVREWVPVSEAEAFAMLPPPEGRHFTPGRTMPPVTICVTLWGPAACGALGMALLGVGGLGELYNVYVVEGGRWGAGANGTYLAGAACCALGLCLPALFCAIGGALIDLVWAVVAVGVRGSQGSKEYAARKYSAWVKKRESLGLETP